MHFTSSHNQKKDNKLKKTKNNQNCQKIKLYGSLYNEGVKEETFIQTGRKCGDRQLGKRGSSARQQLEDQAVQHLCEDKPGGTTGDLDRQ